MIDNYLDLTHYGLVGYVSENILGPSDSSEAFKALKDNFNMHISKMCKCNRICETNCSCKNYKGNGNSYEDVKNRSIRYPSFESIPLFECNSLCSCNKDCGNRVVQKGPIEYLVIKKCQSDKGFGLFTTKNIPKGSFICEYAGEVITKEQALKRHEINKKNGTMNYIFCLNEHSNGGLTTTIVDPSLFGNIGRYINHSCNPNSAIIPVRIDSIIPKLAIFALCDINGNEEITFDYGPSSLLYPEKREKLTKCLCHSKNCKGWLPFEDY